MVDQTITNLYDDSSITDDSLRQAIGIPPINMHQRILRIVVDSMDKLDPERKYKRPQVVYDLKGHTAGQANRNGDHYYIRLNIDCLYNEDQAEHILTVTVPHECAHIFVYQDSPNASGHGVEWKLAMYSLGLNADRTHSLKTTGAKKRWDRPWVYCCPTCDREFKLTDVIHKRIQYMGQRRICKACGTTIVYVRKEVPNV